MWILWQQNDFFLATGYVDTGQMLKNPVQSAYPKDIPHPIAKMVLFINS